MQTDKVTIKKSNINGKGVFALQDFEKGEIILHWNISHTITAEEFQKTSAKQKEYISFLKGKYIIMQEPEKYVNHSCEANTQVKDFCDIAIRNIKKGEEITTNYLEETPGNKSMKCTCKSPKCKKII